jgi:MYXO-CTERM domain-containing protein
MGLTRTAPPGGWGLDRVLGTSALVLACVASCSAAPTAGEPVGATTSAIQGGTDDATHLFAVGVVQLAQEQQNMVAFCSGVLLAPNLVATARHCVAELTSTTIDCMTSTFGALFPASDVLVTTDETITMRSNFVNVTQVIVPMGSGQTTVCGNDIALLILDRNVDLPEYVEPVIDPPMTSSQFEPTVTAIGYGIDTPTDMAGNTAGTRRIKENVPLTCIPNDTSFTDCFSDPNARQVLTANEFVSGDSTCEGDSGSGAFEQGNFDKGNWVAFGVLSRGGVSADGTTCEQPIYSRFDAWGSLLVDAAKQAVAQAAANGESYSLPTWAGGPGLSIDGGVAVSSVEEGGASAITCDDSGDCTAATDSGGGTSGGGGKSGGGCSVASTAGASGNGPWAFVVGLGLAAGVFRRRRMVALRNGIRSLGP